MRVEYVDREQALARAREELGEFKDVFEAGFLPASIDIRLREGFRDPTSVLKVADVVRTNTYVEDVRYGADWIEKLHRIRNIAAATGVILGIAFAAVAIIIISATIRMTVLARAREIRIMRLVGATDAFVRRPFLLDGFAKGVLGGLLALSLSYAAHAVVSKSFLQVDFFSTTDVCRWRGGRRTARHGGQRVFGPSPPQSPPLVRQVRAVCAPRVRARGRRLGPGEHGVTAA